MSRGSKWQPDLPAKEIRTVKTGSDDADDGEGDAIRVASDRCQRDPSSNDVGVASEPCLPELVTDDDSVPCRIGSLGGERASHEHGNSEHLEVVRADKGQTYRLFAEASDHQVLSCCEAG